MPDPPPSAAAPPASKHRLRQLDGMRAVAILLVVCHHLLPPLPVASGVKGYLLRLLPSVTSSGVELFFVLSGVVLMWPYVRLGRPLKVGNYFRRRVERLWPPYLAALGITCLAFATFAAFPNRATASLPVFSASGAARQLGIVNFGWKAYNGAWWSLTPEILFYASLPLILPLVRVPWPRAAWVAAVVGSVALSITCADRLNSAQFSGLAGTLVNAVMYTPCFLLGCVAARLEVPPSLGRFAAVVAITFILISPALTPGYHHVGFALLYFAAIVLSLQHDSLIHRQLSRPSLVWLGERSYSLFLTHFTVFFTTYYLAAWILPYRSIPYFAVTRLLAVPLSFALAMLLFWHVERRFARNLHTSEEFWPPLSRS